MTRSKRRDPVSVSQLLTSQPITELLNKLKLLDKVSQVFRDNLPLHLQANCHVLNLSEDILTIRVNNPTVGHQLYYQQFEILQSINQQLQTDIRHIKIKTYVAS